MGDDATLPDLLRYVRRHWAVAALVTFMVFGGAVVYAEALPDEYESTVVVSFSPKPDTTAGAETVRVVLPKYVAFATAQVTLNRVARKVTLPPDVLRRSIDASVVADSGNLVLRAELPSARHAAETANALAADVLDFARSDNLLDAVIVAPALPSAEPSGPHRALLEAAALVVGALLGVAAAILLERGRPRVRTSRDVGVATGYQVLGRIPSSRRFGTSLTEALSEPAVGAAVRTLRTNLSHLSHERSVGTLVVTSSVAREGKTTLAAALSMSLASLDLNVLLVDGHMNRPGVSRLFALPPGPGLSAVLRGEAALEGCLRPGPVSRLVLLPTASDGNAGDLLARRFARTIAEVRQRFDMVIVDGPPVLGDDDALTLGTLSDGVLMVVAANTRTEVVAEASSALERLDVPVLGAVANRARDIRLLERKGA